MFGNQSFTSSKYWKKQMICKRIKSNQLEQMFCNRNQKSTELAGLLKSSTTAQKWTMPDAVVQSSEGKCMLRLLNQILSIFYSENVINFVGAAKLREKWHIKISTFLEFQDFLEF